MAFKLDFNDTFEGVKDGTYEVVIQSVAEDATKNGAVYLNIPLVIRNDVDQKSRNALIFHAIWQRKDDGKYPIQMINTLGKFAKLNPDKEYQTLEDLFDELTGKPLKVTVKNETSEYNGKTYENLRVKRIDFTDYPNVAHEWKNGNKTKQGNPFDFNENATVDIQEDELPF